MKHKFSLNKFRILKFFLIISLLLPASGVQAQTHVAANPTSAAMSIESYSVGLPATEPGAVTATPTPAVAGEGSSDDSALPAISAQVGVNNLIVEEGTATGLSPDAIPTTSATAGSDLTPNGESRHVTAQATPETTVTVDTTSITIDGDTSSVDNLKANPGGVERVISFPEALTAVNKTGAGFTINFNLPHGATIVLNSTLYLNVSNTTIDGDTTLVEDPHSNDGKPDVVLDAPNGVAPLVIRSNDNEIRNLAITGLQIDGAAAHHNLIVGCYIGTDVEGLVARPRAVDGIEIKNGAHDNVIKNNFIAGNRTSGYVGVVITGSHDNQILGNWIGINVAGNPLANNIGIWIGQGASRNIIGGVRPSYTCDGPCNVISGNIANGVIIYGIGTISNVVQGNYIGVRQNGIAAPNGLPGIAVVFGASQNLIGGPHTLDSEACDGPCNVISGNSQEGIILRDTNTISNVVQGNYIGVSPDGTAARPNGLSGVWVGKGASQNTIGGERVATYEYKCLDSCNLIRGNAGAGVVINGDTSRANAIRGNHIFGNGGLGIDLSWDSIVTHNDPDDSDSGPNDLMNFPLGVTAAFDPNTKKTTITGVIKTMNPTTVMVDIYASEKSDPTGYVEGERYLGKAIIDGSGNFTLTIVGQLPAPFLSATATDSNGSTSEFGTRPPLIFIPGMNASTLIDGVGGDELWLGMWDLFQGSHRRLSLFTSNNPSPNIYASDVIRRVPVPLFEDKPVYGPLLEYLTNPNKGGYREYQVNGIKERRTTAGCDESQKVDNPNLFVFAYDWRLSNIDNAKILKDYVGCIQKFYPGSKVDILAHSNGGLLARRYIILDNETKDQVNKLVTIGTPWLGAPKFLYVMETGAWGGLPQRVFIMNHDTTKYVAGSFIGAHELIPGRAYYDLSAKQSPLIEKDLDFDGNGKIRENNYTYDQYINAINKHYGFHSKGKQEKKFRPGANSDMFHQEPLQDDWSKDETGVNYYHLIGLQEGNRTIDRIAVDYETICSYGRPCETIRKFEIEPYMTIGDETVPLLSAARIGSGQNYNAPKAQRIYFLAAKCGGDEQVQHTNLNINPYVQETVYALLTTGSLPKSECLENQQTASQPAANTSPDNQFSAIEPFPIQPYYYLTIANGTSIVVSDEFGNSTAPINEIFRGEVPGVDTYRISEQIEFMTIPTTGAYTVTFQTTTHAVAIELTAGTGQTATQAVRYQDLTLPPGVTAMLRITPQGAEDLRYDGDGDGTFETSVTPTVSVTGALANDLEPPTITVNVSESLLITLTTQDGGSGVRDLFYSLDGTNYQPYTAPFQIAPSQTTIYAFADDNVANRATLVYPLATLIVIKHVVNDNGGTAIAADFTLNVTGTSPNPASFPGDEYGTTVTLNAGDYSVEETGPTGYTMFLSADCTGTIALGETRTCTVTNDDMPLSRLIDLGTLGGSTSDPFAINEAGQVIGTSHIAGDAERHAFVWESGVMTDLGTLGGNESFARAINEAGQVVGFTGTANYHNHAFLWEDEVMIDLLGTFVEDNWGVGDSYAGAINEAGQVLGGIDLLGERDIAFVWEGGVTTLLTLGGFNSYAARINEAGQVIGYADTVDSSQHAFVWEGGVMTDLGTFGGNESRAVAINEAGQVVGYAWLAKGSEHAFMWDSGVMTDLGTLGGSFSQANDINEAGQIVGSSSTTGDAEGHAFVWDSGVMTDLGTLGGSRSDAVAINEAGQVIGYSYLAGDTELHPFVWEGGVLTDLTLGGSDGRALAINEAGQVIGYSYLAGDAERHAFVWEGGVLTDLGTLGGSTSAPVAINEAGQVIGSSYLAGDEIYHAFVARAATIIVPCSASGLIDAINTANGPEEVDTLELSAGCTYTMTSAASNTSLNGPNGLPIVTSEITIIGNGATITRDGSAPAFRIFQVGDGGGLMLENVTVSGGAAVGGSATVNGGGALLVGSSNGGIGFLTVISTTFFDNHADFKGGAILNLGGSVGVIESTFADNSAASGGAIYYWERGGDITDSTFSGNHAAEDGGAIYGVNTRVTVMSSTFSDNSANNSGGGIFNNDDLYITNSTFSGNRADTGGGIFKDGRNFFVFNSTFSGNSAITTGGAISSYYGATLYNTIVANSPSGGNCAGGEIIDGGNNLQSPGQTCGDSIPTADPVLGPLADNGGLTLTHALLPGSPAIDAGNAAGCLADYYVGTILTTDQRGIVRPLDGDGDGIAICDIGAFEVDVSAPNQPPTASAGGSYNVNEGASVTVTASGSDLEGGALTYAWDLDHDGIFETPGQSATFSAASLDGPSSYTIAVQVTDNSGLTATDQATVNVLNVAPTASFAVTPETLIAGQSATLAFSNQFDPDAADMAAGFLYSYDCTNDGAFELAGASSASYACPYPAAGDFTARGRIEDKDGGFTDYTVGITVTPQQGSPTADAGGPYNVDEGASVTVTASGNDPEGGALTYAWDLDNDGIFETPGQSATFSAASLDGPSSYTIAVQVTDNGGLTATDQATVNVLNVAPTASFAVTPETLIAGQSAALTFSNPLDLGGADTITGLQYSYDCTNDGSFELSDTAVTSYACAYPASGAFTARGRIEDKDGGFTDYTVGITVTPRQGIEGLIDQVHSLNAWGFLSYGHDRALIAKLDGAIKQLEKGKTKTAVNELHAFINQVEAMIAFDILAPWEGQALIDAANAILSALGG